MDSFDPRGLQDKKTQRRTKNTMGSSATRKNPRPVQGAALAEVPQMSLRCHRMDL
jgi:hypothetical protein